MLDVLTMCRYVSGRSRAPGETNGKSANLNNALSLIYPNTPAAAIPPTELVVVFDADMACTKQFFVKVRWRCSHCARLSICSYTAVQFKGQVLG